MAVFLSDSLSLCISGGDVALSFSCVRPPISFSTSFSSFLKARLLLLCHFRVFVHRFILF